MQNPTCENCGASVSMATLLREEPGCGSEGIGPNGDINNHDLAILSDWAAEQARGRNEDWKQAYALIREGCDLLLRRRARSSMPHGSISIKNGIVTAVSSGSRPLASSQANRRIVQPPSAGPRRKR